MINISLCVITKNEGQNIQTCIDSLRDLVNEIIVIDHYSDDDTVEKAKLCGATVYQRRWTHDFAEARNHAIRLAKGKWIIFLDADEYFTPDSAKVLHKVILHAEINKADAILSILTNIEVSTGDTINSMRNIRIFRNRADICYHGKIHETIRSSRGPLKLFDATMDTHVIHTGYSKKSIESKNKSTRNLSLLLNALENDPTSSDLLFYVSESYLLRPDLEKGLTYATKAIECDRFTLPGAVEKNFLNLVGCMKELHYPEDDIRITLKKAIEKCPGFPDFYFQMAFLYRKQGRHFDAIDQYSKGIQNIAKFLSSQSSAIGSLDKVFYDLGRLYEDTNQIHDSVKCYVESLKFNSYHFASLQRLVSMLSSNESPEAIVGFLQELYRDRNIKNLLYQFRAALQSYNSQLAVYFYNQFSSEQCKELKFENAMLCLILGEYKACCTLFLELYLATHDTNHAIFYIAGALSSNRPDLLARLKDHAESGIYQLVNHLLQETEPGLYTYESELLLKLWEVLIRVREIDIAMQLLPCIKEDKVKLPAAQIAMVEKQYSLALNLLIPVISQARLESTERLSIVHLEVARCFRSRGEWNRSLQHCMEAHRLNPNLYGPYELMIEISRATGMDAQKSEVIEEGRSRFGDSIWLKQSI